MILTCLCRTTFRNLMIMFCGTSQQDTPTLQSCWDKGRNIIVSYDYPGNQQLDLWGKIPYYYANTMDPAKVESELCRVLEKARPSHCESSLPLFTDRQKNTAKLSLWLPSPPTTSRFLCVWLEPDSTRRQHDLQVRTLAPRKLHQSHKEESPRAAAVGQTADGQKSQHYRLRCGDSRQLCGNSCPAQSLKKQMKVMDGQYVGSYYCLSFGRT